MGGPRRIGPRTATTALVLTVQLAVCLVALLVPIDRSPHHAPITISGPAVVATALADQADGRPGDPLDATPAKDARAARDDVEQGRAVAALAIDLRLDRATLFTSSAQGAELTDAVVGVMQVLGEPFAVTITRQDVAPVPSGSAGQAGLRLATGCAVLLGLGIAIAVTAWRGPVADTWRAAVRRMLFTAAVAVVSSGILAVVSAWRVGGGVPGWWAALVLIVLATSAATLALEGVLGASGIGVATLTFVVTAAPLARVQHPLLLPDPWGAVTPWLPHGAGLDVARQVAFLDGPGPVRPWLVLVAWVLVSCVVLAIARRERRRAGVVWRRAGSGVGGRA